MRNKEQKSAKKAKRQGDIARRRPKTRIQRAGEAACSCLYNFDWKVWFCIALDYVHNLLMSESSWLSVINLNILLK